MVELLLKYPTRSRPELFKSTFERYINFLSGKHSYKFVISCDTDDTTMNNARMIDYITSKPNVELFFNSPPQNKISAINANMSDQHFETLLLVSDDMIPQKRGYDHIILEDMEKHFGKNQYGVLHYNDGRVGITLNTLSIMNKKMYDYFGYIYNPDYISLWCDNEFHEITSHIGCVQYIENQIICHKWKAKNDDLYDRNETFYNQDEIKFSGRKGQNFPRPGSYSVVRNHDLSISKLGIILTDKTLSEHIALPKNCIVEVGGDGAIWDVIKTSMRQLKSKGADVFCCINKAQSIKPYGINIMQELCRNYNGLITGSKNKSYPKYESFDDFYISSGFNGDNFLVGNDLYDLVISSLNNKYWNWELSNTMWSQQLPVLYTVPSVLS